MIAKPRKHKPVDVDLIAAWVFLFVVLGGALTMFALLCRELH